GGRTPGPACDTRTPVDAVGRQGGTAGTLRGRRHLCCLWEDIEVHFQSRYGPLPSPSTGEGRGGGEARVSTSIPATTPHPSLPPPGGKEQYVTGILGLVLQQMRSLCVAQWLTAHSLACTACSI